MPNRDLPEPKTGLSDHPETYPPAAHLWTLPGGLRVAFERRRTPGFAFDLRLAVGSAHDPVGLEGSAGVLEEWLFKGAASHEGVQRDARALQDAFDDLGVRRGGGVSPEATRFGVSGLREDLAAALTLVSDVLMRPHLPESELPVLLDLARQDLEGLQDSPADLLALHARQAAFPRPSGSPYAGFTHPASGTPEGLQNLNAGQLTPQLGRYGQAGAVLGLVADLELEEALELAQYTFGDLRPGQNDVVEAQFQAGSRIHIPEEDAEQTHISITAPGIAPTDPRWLVWQVALTALSGGSASRLFHAVREERGLAYSVSASPVILGAQGFLTAYAGSTPARAPETLEVILAELSRLPRGLTDAEFQRARAGLTASVVFGAESLRARAGALTRDVAVFGRIRSVQELKDSLNRLTLHDINAFLAEYDPARDASIVSLGPGESGGVHA